jgi:hypothetical protein
MSIPELTEALREAINGGQIAGSLIAVFVIALVIFLVLVSAIYLFYLSSPRGRLESLVDQKTQRGAAATWVPRLGVIVLALAVFGLADNYVQRDSTCASCHTDNKHVESLEASAHRGLDCVSCHGASGVTGPVRQLVDYGRWMYVSAANEKLPDLQAGSVESSKCLSCHEDVRRGTLQAGGIRMRHSDVIEAGYRCRECHNSTAHGDITLEPSSPSMSTCLSCHDGERASTDCKACHAEETSRTAKRTGQLANVVVQANSTNCYTCHGDDSCQSCHGTVMPHPPEFGLKADGTAGGHAREAFAKRDVCWRCHYDEGKIFEEPESCGSCHGVMGRQHGGKPWVKEHGLQATGKKPGVFSSCFSCHTQTLCDNCHTPEYRDMYNPVTGEDQYRRDIPLPPEAEDW